ncbi:hypothetical protein N9H45_02860 [Opitutales bacterium]|nr:hypothetical protein [Opitutales bacterium]
MKFLTPLLFLNTFLPMLGQEKVEESMFSGFSGQVMARVEGIVSGGVRVRVLQVSRVWKNNQAKNTEGLIQKSILVRASGSKESREIQTAYMSGLRVGQTVPIEIKKKQVKYWEILELNAEQKKLATNRMNAKRRALAQRAGDEVSEKRQDGRVEDNVANSDIYKGANDKDTVKQLNRLKRENADLRSRLLKLESRLKWMEEQAKK